MAIFNNNTFTSVMEQDESYIAEQYPYIMPTIEAAYEIACEGYADVHKLIAGLYVSDVLIETAVAEGSDAEPLIEGAISDFLKKVKDKFIEIKNKIIAWFKKIIENLKIRFTSSAKFVQTYKKQIAEKAKTSAMANFTTTIHTKLIGADIVGEVTKAIETIKTVASTDKGSEKFPEIMAKKVHSKASTIGELKEAITNEIMGDEDKEKRLSSSDVNKMIDFCSTINSTIEKLNGIKDKGTKAIDQFIKDLDKVNANEDKISKKVSNYNTAISAIQQMNTVGVSLVNKANSEFIAILRAFMLFKPAKESYSGEDLMEESNGIFESALNMI